MSSISPSVLPAANRRGYIHARDPRLKRRREQVLTALSITPLDGKQMLALSETFALHFGSVGKVRKLMAKLVAKKLVLEFEFKSGDKYWKLSPDGYKKVYGPGKAIPGPKAYKPISNLMLEHTPRLADLLVKLQVSAHRNSCEIEFIYGDKQSRLTHEQEKREPDAMLGFRVKGRKQTYTYVFEHDCGTEPVYTKQTRESLEQKVKFYLGHEAAAEGSYRVLFTFNQRSSRLFHFLDLVDEVNTDPRRRVIKGAYLDDILQSPDPLFSPVLYDWDHQRTAMLPGNDAAAVTIPAGFVDAVSVAC